MKLTSIELAKPHVEEVKTAEPMTNGWYEKFPYGMRITMDTSVLDKLNIDVADYPTGTTVKVIAEATIIRTTDEKSIDDSTGAVRSIEMQITEVAIEPSVEADFERSFNEAVNEEY